MNSRLFFLALALLLGTTLQAQQFETAGDAVRNMRVGWNLGNTLDSNSGDTLNMWIEHWTDRTPTAYETAWGQAVTRPELFTLLRSKGFNAVRVPVTWYPHLEAKFEFETWENSIWKASQDDLGTTIDMAWMQRVREVVDYVIGQDMYCILNIHHDTGAESAAWLIADEDVYNREHGRFEAVWRQIAEEFRDYDEHLLFEGYNEMLDRKRSWCFASYNADNRYDAQMAASAYNAINAYAQSFVSTVRSTGGNNAQRNLIVCTYGACDGNGSWNSHLQDPLKDMRLPDDTTEGHLLFEVHSYADVSNPSSAKSTLNATISSLKRHLTSKGAPLIFGEWGASSGGDNMANLCSYAQYFAQQARENGMGLFYWMGVSNGSDRSIPVISEPDLVEAMMKGYYGEQGFTDGLRPVTAPDSPENSYDLQGRPSKAGAHGIIISNKKKYLSQ